MVDREDHKDVVVVGGGQAALALGFYLRRSDLTYAILDEQDSGGGSWRRGWETLRAFSPAEWSSLPGWLMPRAADGGSEYPSRKVVVDYLSNYESRYQLAIRRGIHVDSVEKMANDSRLLIRTNFESWYARSVISATGGKAFLPKIEGQNDFGGKQLHSIEYSTPQSFRRKRVVVVGAGNSAAQIVAELTEPDRGVGRVTWATLETPTFLPDDIPGTGLAVLHTHPGNGVPQWSPDDNNADEELARFLFGEGFLALDVPLVSLVVSHTDLRGRQLSLAHQGQAVVMLPIERVRTLGLARFEVSSTADRAREPGELEVPPWAERSVRVFGKEGQRLLADLHIAVVGAGGVGSIVCEQIARWGIGRISIFDPDIIKDVNVNRSGVFTFAHARRAALKAKTLARALRSFSLVRTISVRSSSVDVRRREELPGLLDSDLILMLVDDARARNFVNRVAYAHYIPALDGGNVIRSTAEDDADADLATIEGGGVRISYFTPTGACAWCAGHLDSGRLALAFRSDADKAADRARGYVEHLGPEHAPSVMPVNSLTAALLEYRLQDLLFGLSGRSIPEIHFDILGGTLDELPRKQRRQCRHCERWQGKGDSAELPFIE